ncbi:MAG: hypothetical protein IJW26_03155 [Clostridia bacterium]|nr:hypothetical protein [Clostridia bacterium]
MKNAKLVAVSGVTTALSVIVLALGTYIEVIDLSCLFIASLFIMIPLSKGSFKSAFLCYLAVSILSLIFTASTGRFSISVLYVAFFGLYPLALYFEEKKNINKFISYPIKAIWFIGTCFLMYFVFKMFILTNETLEKYLIAIIIIGGLIVFIAFDYMMKRFQKLTTQIVKRLNL